MSDDNLNDDPEFNAMKQVHASLLPLSNDARIRVMAYVSQRLNIQSEIFVNSEENKDINFEEGGSSNTENPQQRTNESQTNDTALDGISPVALKWIRRNGFDIEAFSKVYSLGIDDIDLVAQTIPGKSKREKTKNVVRLVCIVEYLASGAARASYEEIKEACTHYQAFDNPNHAANLKSMGAELNGSRENGFTLSAKGITAAAELIKSMIKGEKS